MGVFTDEEDPFVPWTGVLGNGRSAITSAIFATLIGYKCVKKQKIH